ncbi:MAG: hypothetical protein BIFFINMI_03880 [Phycisphaerae bacterium]|nr:hypothetical protein [Phycisphaerae bacterium]
MTIRKPLLNLFLIALAILAVTLLADRPQWADDRPAPAAPADSPAADDDSRPLENRGAAWELPPGTQEKVSKGLEWLKAQQQPDGAFGTGPYGKHAGISALAGLAFLAEGSTYDRGQYGEQVKKVTQFIMQCTSDSTGLIASPQVSHGPMYGHGFAALFLAEVYGMTGRVEVRDKLRLAIRLIVNTQNDQGGWRYMPVPQDADLSVTICQIMALRAARNAGIKVPKKTIDKAIEYVKKSQNGDGGFNYTMTGGGSAFPRSAAGVAALQYMGIYSGKEIDKGIGYLLKSLPSAGPRGVGYDGHFFYGHYYAVQAFFLRGGEDWHKWFPAIRDTLLKMQASDGSWPSSVSNEYGTALALIILQVPNRYLPILER